MAGVSVNGDERFMRLALDEARSARRDGEVPVGALVTRDDEVLGVGRNSPIRAIDPTAHAEMVALRAAAAREGNYRLVGATLYCTVEPCLMCIGAALHARIARIVWAASDPKIGAVSRFEAMVTAGADFNHRFETCSGVLADESVALLRSFFRERRKDGGSEERRTGDPGSDDGSVER